MKLVLVMALMIPMALLLTTGCLLAGAPVIGVDRTAGGRYPAHWWLHVPAADQAWWEILPQAAGPGEVILSKRNELGLLSNFAATPFVYRTQRYASLEGLWQSMKYPEGPDDPRARRAERSGLTWPLLRHLHEDPCRASEIAWPAEDPWLGHMS